MTDALFHLPLFQKGLRGRTGDLYVSLYVNKIPGRQVPDPALSLHRGLPAQVSV